MERFHFAFAREFTHALPGFSPQSPVVVEVNSAFGRNILRMQSVANFPILIVGASVVMQHFEVKARLQLKIEDSDPELTVGHAQFSEERYKEKEALRLALQLEWHAQSQRGEVPGGMTIGEVNLALLVPLGKPETEEAIDAILGGMVIAAWTAFETMASDLWVAALNAHPVKLAALSGTWHKPEKFEADELTEDEEDQKQDKTVKLQDLQMNGYDLSKKMGSVHKYRFKWGVLEGIRRAYGAAFSNHYDEIKSAIEDHSIDALAAARNVLVHKAGVVDGKFKKKHRNWPAFAGLEPETVLQLDGVAVRDLLGASLGSAIKLMNAVDIWLVSY